MSVMNRFSECFPHLLLVEQTKLTPLVEPMTLRQTNTALFGAVFAYRDVSEPVKGPLVDSAHFKGYVFETNKALQWPALDPVTEKHKVGLVEKSGSDESPCPCAKCCICVHNLHLKMVCRKLMTAT